MPATWVVVADRNCATISTVPRGMARLRQLCDLRCSRTSIGRDDGRQGSREFRISDAALNSVERQARSFAAELEL